MSRIRGTVTKVKESYGFVRGEDGQERFFIPSGLCDPWKFDQLKVGSTLEFTHVEGRAGKSGRAVEAVEIPASVVDTGDED